MLLVAPDPRLGIAPERISRVRTLLDGLPTAPGLAVALPGGPDGELDAVVLRPDGVLGLVPAVSSRRVGVGGGSPGSDGSQEQAAAEIDRLLALTDPAPTAPRQVVPIVDRPPPSVPRGEDPERTDEDTGIGVATAARLVLTASAGPIVLDAAEVRRLLVAWRLAEFLPDGADLRAAGFPGDGHDGGSGPSGPAVVPASRSAVASAPGGAPAAPGPPRTGVLPTGPDGPASRPPTAPFPTTSGTAVAPGPLGPWASDPGSRARRRRDPQSRREPQGRRGARDRRGPASRRVAALGWLGTWRGLAIAAAGVFAVALGVALLVVRGASPTPEDVAALPVRVVDGVPWTQQVVTTEATCEGHAYGLAVQFLRAHPCVQLDRSLWSGDVGGSAMVASVAVVRMGDAASASAFKALVDSSGTGNVADLLREGRGFAGAPASLGNAGYGSTQLGNSVVITETAPGAGSGAVGESTLDRVARQATGLA